MLTRRVVVCLDVNDDRVARPDVELRCVLGRAFDHQVDEKREIDPLPQGVDDGRPEREVRHEVAVHDVDVEHVGPAFLRELDLFRQLGVVGGQYRRGYLHHRLWERSLSIKLYQPVLTCATHEIVERIKYAVGGAP